MYSDTITLVDRRNPELVLQEESEIKGWLLELLGEVEEEEYGKFSEIIKDGSVLCRVMNAIKPGSIASKHLQPAKNAFKRAESISNFLRACKSYAPSVVLFDTVDLLEEKKMHLVRRCILALKQEYLAREQVSQVESKKTEPEKPPPAPTVEKPPEPPRAAPSSQRNAATLDHSQLLNIVIVKPARLGLSLNFSVEKKTIAVTEIDDEIASLEVRRKFQVEDQILAVNSERIKSLEHLVEALGDVEEGEEVEFQIRRSSHTVSEQAGCSPEEISPPNEHLANISHSSLRIPSKPTPKLEKPDDQDNAFLHTQNLITEGSAHGIRCLAPPRLGSPRASITERKSLVLPTTCPERSSKECGKPTGVSEKKGVTLIDALASWTKHKALETASREGSFDAVDMNCGDLADSSPSIEPAPSSKPVFHQSFTTAGSKRGPDKSVSFAPESHLVQIQILEQPSPLGENSPSSESPKQDKAASHITMAGCVSPGISTSLHEAAGAGQVAEIDRLLQQGVCINSRNRSGATALHLAVKSAHLRVTQFLIDKGADLQCKTKSLTTTLHAAVEGGSAEIVRLLLATNQIPVDCTTSQQATPLHMAAKLPTSSVCDVLLENGANVNAQTENGSTPLHLACGAGYDETVQCLLQHGALVNAQTTEASLSATPLHLAATNGHANIVAVLLDARADPKAVMANGTDALLAACQWGHSAVVKLLLRRGADVDFVDSNGWTCLHTAAYYAHESIVMQLIEFGANPNSTDNRGLLPGTSFIRGSSSSKTTKITKFLADIRNQNQAGFWRSKLAQDKRVSALTMMSLEEKIEELEHTCAARGLEIKNLTADKDQLAEEVTKCQTQSSEELEALKAKMGALILENETRAEEMKREVEAALNRADEQIRQDMELKIATVREAEQLAEELRNTQVMYKSAILEEKSAKEELSKQTFRVQEIEQHLLEKEREWTNHIEELRKQYEQKEETLVIWNQRLETKANQASTEKEQMREQVELLEKKIKDLVVETSNIRSSHASELRRLKEEKLTKEAELEKERLDIGDKLKALEEIYSEKFSARELEHKEAEAELQGQVQALEAQAEELQAQIRTIRKIDLQSLRESREKKIEEEFKRMEMQAEQEKQKLIAEAQSASKKSLIRAAEAEDALQKVKDEAELLHQQLGQKDAQLAVTLEAERISWQEQLDRANGWAKELEAAVELTNLVHQRREEELLQQISDLKEEAIKAEQSRKQRRNSNDPDHPKMSFLWEQKQVVEKKLVEEKERVVLLQTEISSLNVKIEEFEKYAEKMQSLNEKIESAISQRIDTATEEYKVKLRSLEKENRAMTESVQNSEQGAQVLAQKVRSLEADISLASRRKRQELEAQKEYANGLEKEIEKLKDQIREYKVSGGAVKLSHTEHSESFSKKNSKRVNELIQTIVLLEKDKKTLEAKLKQHENPQPSRKLQNQNDEPPATYFDSNSEQSDEDNEEEEAEDGSRLVRFRLDDGWDEDDLHEK